MLKTTNYQMNKPELTDSPPDITVLNKNFDIIDEELAHINKSPGNLQNQIDLINSNKIDYTDIINNITVGGINKVLSAEQGKVIANLLSEKAKQSDMDKLILTANKRIIEDCLLIGGEYEQGIWGVRAGLTANLPNGFAVGIRECFRYDANNAFVRITDTNTGIVYSNTWATTKWTGWTSLSVAPSGLAGIGQWKSLISGDNTAMTLPSGGTWAYMLLIMNAGVGTLYNFIVNVTAGGTTIMPATSGKTSYALIWRIA